KFVEGQVPVWYHEFARRRGESPELRPDRLRLLQRAVDVRTQAERVASRNARLNALIQRPIDEGDKSRRKAQDYLFGGDQASMRLSGEWFGRAQSSYDKGAKTIDPLADALDLLWKVLDGLPYYGEWNAQAGRSGGTAAEVGKATAELANLLYGDPGR